MCECPLKLMFHQALISSSVSGLYPKHSCVDTILEQTLLTRFVFCWIQTFHALVDLKIFPILRVNAHGARDVAQTAAFSIAPGSNPAKFKACPNLAVSFTKEKNDMMSHSSRGY
ncbi:hypothetical protein PoB_004010000 [Plakobranchus ocellatus]|uniref:Uncharacterized protein n=1 Tax=Plakobranchus ocellatus TaxID=259542 RepID=A0AAV4B1X8_9GAST|nr:hypothetical protein PoB_004010000 [Plakobranchus ocellatus]